MVLTDRLVNHLVTLSETELLEVDKRQVRRCLTDYLGVTYAGAQILKDKAEAYHDLAGSTGSFRALGFSRPVQLTTAAFLNGLFSHVAELDDGDRFGMFHPGAPIFSALLPLIQKYPVSTSGFEKAIICGYEASMLIARTMQPHLKERGFHGTGIAGIIGAAVACAIALNANGEELKAVLSAATTSASGLLKVIKGKSQMKPLNVAYAAQNGLQAALVMKAGFAGSDDVLDGDLGFFKAYSDKLKTDVICNASANESRLIHSIYVKPYAACRHCHAPIEAAISISHKVNLSLDDIESVKVHTYEWAITGHDHTEITGMNSAKMSIPYSVAAALVKKRGDIHVYDEPYLSDRQIVHLARKVSVIEDLEMSSNAPAKRSSRVEVKLKSGIEKDNDGYTCFVSLPKGEPENPMTDEELVHKAEGLCYFAGMEAAKKNQVLSLIGTKDLDSKTIGAVIYS